MIKSKVLTKNSTVMIVSLSSGMAGDPEFYPRYLYGKERIKALFGPNVHEAPHSLKGSEFVYKHPELRAQELMEAFLNPEIDAIISTIGGDDAIRLLPYIDFNVIRNNPKVFMGYSDSTIIHFMCYKAGLVSFSGPCILMEFAENVKMHDYTLEHLHKTLFRKEPVGYIMPSETWTNEFLPWSDSANLHKERHMISNSPYELLQGKGIHRGKLLGGCIECLEFMKGTILWPSLEEWRDKFLFLETSEDKPSPSQILWYLRNYAAMGLLQVISGILFAKPQDEVYYQEYNQVLLQVVRDECGLVDLPIMTNMSFGHNSPICILPMGVMAELNCDECTFSIEESAVV